MKNKFWLIQLFLIGVFLSLTNSCSKDDAPSSTKKNPIITWSNPADIAFGTMLSVTQLNATANIPGTFVYTPTIGTILNAGANQNLKVDFTPTDVANYNVISITVKINVTTIVIPVLTTTVISSITAISASSGGNIVSDGGSPVTARGIVWSTSPNPTIAFSTKTNNGSGIGSFTSSVTGLSALTTYYLRAYATNSKGTGYGNEINFTTGQSIITVTDIDGNVYPTVKICNQTWIAKNLDVSRYQNGDVIPQARTEFEWTQSTYGAWCYYALNSDTGIIYGKMYNWHAVNDPRGLAPKGYHIPSYDEWLTLANCLGGETIAGDALKETGTRHWNAPNAGATNSSGFTALPGGNISFSNGLSENLAVGVNGGALRHLEAIQLDLY
ncbi:MAG: fibrobacter succinogenes major paralogous domain-containing protein [Saprospiraceae bacterium]|nr:fibrobacter succinogenes major paralogous domain-containing protein [Saprospiraceae bacterium]